MNQIKTLIPSIMLIAAHFMVGCSPESTSQMPQAKAQTSKFSTVDICKAGLSSMYHQPVSSMSSGNAVDGNVLISYKKQQNGREFKYRCKLAGENILTFDENIKGARWYGVSTDNSKLIYKEEDTRLVITDVMGSQLTQHPFTLNEFNNTSGNHLNDELAQEQMLISYATDITKKYSFLTFRSIKKTTNDPLAYIIVFQTTSTDRLIKTDATDNSNSYELNIKKTEKWKDMFCTNNLKTKMQERSVGMVTGIIQDVHKTDHNLAPCF